MGTLTHAKNGNDKMGMIVKRVSVPIGLEELMEGLSKEVLLKKPKDLYLFASEYFARLVNIREKSNKYKAHPVHIVQSVTRLRDPNIQLTKKVSTPRPTKHTSSKQSSLRSKSQSSTRPTDSTTENNTALKNNERKSKRDRNNSTSKAVSKSVASRDVSLSKRSGGASTDTSSLQSTPREKRQSTGTRRSKSTQRNNNTKSHDQTTLKGNKSDKVKTALIPPTVLGGTAVVAAIATSNTLDKDVTSQEKSEMFDSDILARSTNLSSIGDSEKNSQNTEKQPNVEDRSKNIKLDNESNILDKESLDYPLDSDILESTTNADEISKQMLLSNKEEKCSETDETSSKKNNEDTVMTQDKSSVVEDNILHNEEIERKKECNLAEDNHGDSLRTENSQEINISSKPPETVDTFSNTKIENTVRDKSIDHGIDGIYSQNIQDQSTDGISAKEIPKDIGNQEIEEVTNNTDDSKPNHKENENKLPKELNNATINSISNADIESQSEKKGFEMTDGDIGRGNSEIDLVENKKIGLLETKQKNSVEDDEERGSKNVEQILNFNSVKDLLDFDLSTNHQNEQASSNMGKNIDSTTGKESKSISEAEKEVEQISLDKEKHSVDQTIKNIERDNETNPVDDTTMKSSTITEVQENNDLDKETVAANTLNEFEPATIESKQIFTNNRKDDDIEEESKATTKTIEQISPVKETDLLITEPNEHSSLEKEHILHDDITEESNSTTKPNKSLSSDIGTHVVNNIASDSKLLTEVNKKISVDNEKCKVDDSAMKMENITEAINKTSSKEAKYLNEEIGNGLSCATEAKEKVFVVEEKHMNDDTIKASKYTAQENELISTDDKGYEVNHVAKVMNTTTEENGKISANMNKAVVDDVEKGSKTVNEVKKQISDKTIDLIDKIPIELNSTNKTKEIMSSVQEKDVIDNTGKKLEASIEANEQISHDKADDVHDDNINGSNTITEKGIGHTSSIKGIYSDDADNTATLRPITESDQHISSGKEIDVVDDTANESETKTKSKEQISSDETKDLINDIVKELEPSNERDDQIPSVEKNNVSDDSITTAEKVMEQTPSGTETYLDDGNKEELKASTEKLSSIKGQEFIANNTKVPNTAVNDTTDQSLSVERTGLIDNSKKLISTIEANEQTSSVRENDMIHEATEKNSSAEGTGLVHDDAEKLNPTTEANKKISSMEEDDVVIDTVNESGTTTEANEKIPYVTKKDLIDNTEKQSGNNTEPKEEISPDEKKNIVDELLREPEHVDIDSKEESETTTKAIETSFSDKNTFRDVEMVKKSEYSVASNEQNSSDNKNDVVVNTPKDPKNSTEGNEQVSFNKEHNIVDDITKKSINTTELKKPLSSDQVDEHMKKTRFSKEEDDEISSEKENYLVDDVGKEAAPTIEENNQITSLNEKDNINNIRTESSHSGIEASYLVNNTLKELKPITEVNIKKSSEKEEIAVVNDTVKESKANTERIKLLSPDSANDIAKSARITTANEQIPSNEEENIVDDISNLSKSTSETKEQIPSEYEEKIVSDHISSDNEKNVVAEGPNNLRHMNNAENIKTNNKDSLYEMEKTNSTNVTTISNVADINSSIDIITKIMSSKLCAEKSGRIDNSISQFLDTFLKYEQTDVFKIDETKEQTPSGGEHVSDKQNSKELGQYVDLKNGMEISRKNSLIKEKSSSKSNSTNGNRIRRVRSVGLIKLGENEQTSKIPTPTRRSAGRRPLVRQLETDSRDLEDQISFEKKLKKFEKSSKSIERITDNTSNKNLNGISKSCKKPETKKVDKNSAKNYATERKKDDLDAKETNISKEDVFIAKTILQGIEGAHKLIENIDEKTTKNTESLQKHYSEVYNKTESDNSYDSKRTADQDSSVGEKLNDIDIRDGLPGDKEMKQKLDFSEKFGNNSENDEKVTETVKNNRSVDNEEILNDPVAEQDKNVDKMIQRGEETLSECNKIETDNTKSKTGKDAISTELQHIFDSSGNQKSGETETNQIQKVMFAPAENDTIYQQGKEKPAKTHSVTEENNDQIKMDKAAIIIQKIWKGFHIRQVKPKISITLEKQHDTKPQIKSSEEDLKEIHKDMFTPSKNDTIYQQGKEKPGETCSVTEENNDKIKMDKAAIIIQKIWKGFHIRQVKPKISITLEKQHDTKPQIKSSEEDLKEIQKDKFVPSKNDTIYQKGKEKPAKTCSLTEEKNDQIKMDKAAIIIQKIWKGFHIRQVKPKISITLEKQQNSKPQTKCSEEDLKEVQSAIKIQSLWRGFLVRKSRKNVKSRKLLEQEYAITKIQAVVRGYLERLKFEKAKNKETKTSSVNNILAPDIDQDSTKLPSTISNELQQNIDTDKNSLVNDQAQTDIKLNEGDKSIEKKYNTLEDEIKDKTTQNNINQETTEISSTTKKETSREGIITDNQKMLKEDEENGLKSIEIDCNGKTKNKVKEEEESTAETSSKINDSQESLQFSKKSINGEVDNKYNNSEPLSENIESKNKDSTEEKTVSLNEKVNNGYIEIEKEHSENHISLKSSDVNRDIEELGIGNNFEEHSDKNQTIGGIQLENTEIKAPEKTINNISENVSTADKIQDNDGNTIRDGINNSKPDFYRTDTVTEPEIVKKNVSETTNSTTEGKDDNNNSEIKEETNLEREVRSTINNILKSNDEKQSSLKVEIQDVVENIMHYGSNNDNKSEIDHGIENDGEPPNVDTIIEMVPRVPSSEILEHQPNEKKENGCNKMAEKTVSGIGRSAEEEKFKASSENITVQNEAQPHELVKETKPHNDNVSSEQTVIIKTLNKNENISESLSDDVSSVDSTDSVTTIIPNTNYENIYKIKKTETEERPRSSRALSHDIIHDKNISGVSKSLPTDALGDHVELIDQVQNTLLDQISGKSVDTVSKFDIDQLRKELHEAASLYKSEDDNNHLTAHNEELLEYLSDFEPEEDSTYDSRIIRTPNRELPDIEEEADSKEDENDDAKNVAQPGIRAEENTEFCGVPLSISTCAEKLIDNKPLKDHVEIIDVEKVKHDHKNTVMDNNKIHINKIENDATNSASKTDKSPTLLHTSELHDSIVIPLGNLTTKSQVTASSNLKHTSEFHDTLVMPLPSGSDLNIKNEGDEAMREKPTAQSRPESVDIGNQTSFQQQAPGQVFVIIINDAWNRIADNLNVPVNELKKKKESLMATFRMHHKKKMQSIKSGMGEDELYNPIWPFYEPLNSFLKDVYECHSLINTEDNSASQSTYIEEQTSTDADLNTPVPGTSSHSEIVPGTNSNSETNKIKVPIVKRRSKDPPELVEASREMTNAFSTLNKVLNRNTATPDDDCELYGRLLATKLRKFSESEREEIMLDIDNMIINRRRKKQNTHNNSYTYTTLPGSSQSSDQSEWSYRSPSPHSHPPSADVNRSTYTPYQAPTQQLQILSNEILPVQSIQPGPSLNIQPQSHVYTQLPEMSPQSDETYSLQSPSNQFQNILYGAYKNT